jgi:GT2 family glycosyltransferase
VPVLLPGRTPLQAQPDLSILIVNWNSAPFLEKCLASIYANAGNVKFEAIVVDNASRDGSREMVRGKFPEVLFLQNPANLGFAQANNLAFGHSRGRNVLFLNPDTEVVGPALSSMVEFLAATPDAGVVGPKLLNSDFSVQTTSIMRFPSLWREALDVEALRLAFPGFPVWNLAPLFRGNGGGAVVEAISGACMLLRRNVFENIGQFDTSYFLFSEDLDLCDRVRQAGWKVYYFGGATVVHHGGRSTAARPDGFRTVLIQEAHAAFLRRRRGRLAAALYKRGMAAVAVIRLAALGTLFVATAGRFQRQRLRLAFSRWTTVFGWATGWGREAREFLAPGNGKQSRGQTAAPFPERQNPGPASSSLPSRGSGKAKKTDAGASL